LKSRQQQAETALAALDLDGLTSAAKDAVQARDEAEKHTATCRQALTEATTALEKAQSQAEAASSQANEKSTLLARINAEKDALDALLTPQDESASPISSSVKVKNGYEQALAVALGDALTAPMGKSSSAYWLEDAIAAQATCPQGTTPLADHLDLPPALTAALSGVGVVEDASAAEAAQKTLAPGQAITTIEGGLWRWDGYVQPLGAETSAAMRLKQEARLRELTAEFAAAEQEAETALEASTSSKATLDAAREALQNHRQAERQAEQDLSQALRRDESARSALETAEKRRDELTETLSMLSSGLTEAEAELSALADPAALVAEAERLRIEAEACRQTLAETMGSERTIRSARDQRQTRRDAITRETDIWAERQKGAHARIDELASRKGQAEHDAQTLANQPQVIAERRHALGDAIDKAEAERRDAGDVLAEAETELAQADAAQRDADQALSQQREGYIRCESQRDLAKQDLESITNRIRERLNASPDALRELAEMNPDDAIDCDDDTIANLEQRHERLIRERENIGPVNLRAEAEMQEVDERIASINTECDDLNAAISKLRSAISQLNREGRERLLKSFTEVNRYFETLFKSLFNGGSAELKLTEADDPLDAGLEILASPPGKKLQSLSLLSGGEQALTALALIFAVFLTNPSPICILDEVDAPLDDTNVARFCDMLSQIAQETGTRFIVVTHHRLTMAKMDRLYGVTMEQKGVSRIVSVDLQAAERFKESA